MRLAMAAGLVFAVGPGRSVLAQEPRVATNLVTHNQIEIARPAAAIWPYIVDPSTWKQGTRLIRHSGPSGQVGEVFAAVTPANSKEPLFFVENVELEPNRRRTIKLVATGGELIGFAVFTLEESAGRTIVGYDVYSETVLPPDRAKAMPADSVAQIERADHEANSKRFQAELESLKRLVETAGGRLGR